MTAEICVMNKHGISIAADSAVTMRNGSNTKVFDSAEKIFTLSKKYPVGIMIYGRSDYLSNPFEIIIKEYRDRNLDKKFDSIKEWGNDFIKFISTFMLSYYNLDELKNLENNEIKKKIIEIIDEVINDFNKNKMKYQQESGIADMGKSFCAFLNEKNKKLKEMYNAEGKSFNTKQIEDFFEFSRIQLKNRLVENYYSDEQADIIVGIVETILLGSKFDISGISGIVIMGYGDNEIYPNLIGYKIKGQYQNGIIYKVDREIKISPFMPTAAIVPFAQVDVVNTFISGISDVFITEIHNIINEENKQLVNRLESVYNSEIAENVKKVIEKESIIVHNRVRDYLELLVKDYNSPLINMVALLPKDELSSLSEALVSITSLKRRVSSDDNTVGGPIDVAMITRSEGFVWIKRKHYFASELNHSFFSNYFNDKGE